MRLRTEPGSTVLSVASVALIILAVFCVLAVLGCATTERPVRTVRVEVPVPYWDPPTDIADLPPETPMESQRISEADAVADPKRALTALADDLTKLLGEVEEVRWLYSELVKLITAAPPVRPDDPPSGGGGGSPPDPP